MTEWRIRAEMSVLHTPWFEVNLAEVQLPDGRNLEHYLFRLPPVVLMAMLDDQDRVLLVWRYRFIAGTWGWELPSGLADPSEDFPAAATREALKETGWKAMDPRPLIELDALPGLAGSTQHVYWTNHARHLSEPGWETTHMEWMSLRDCEALIAAGRMRAATTVAALLHLRAGRPAA